MCSNLISKQRLITVGDHMVTYGGKGTAHKRFGNGHYHNARLEKLDSLYKNFDKCTVDCEMFYEGKGLFHLLNDVLMNLAAVEDEDSILIVTKPSINTIVQTYHGRMPAILAEPQQFISHGKIIELPSSFLRLVI